jgi:hypothetical protein
MLTSVQRRPLEAPSLVSLFAFNQRWLDHAADSFRRIGISKPPDQAFHA